MIFKGITKKQMKEYNHIKAELEAMSDDEVLEKYSEYYKKSTNNIIGGTALIVIGAVLLIIAWVMFG